MDQEQEEIFGSWQPPQVRGIIEFTATATTHVSNVIVGKRVSSRRQFKMTMAPCPEVLAEVMGHGFGSLLHLNPVEISRRIESVRTTPGLPEDEPQAGSVEDDDES